LLSNFRPISITCVSCKLLERLITSKIYDHLVHNNIINSNQHGFVRGKSTCTNLLESLNDWTSYVEDGCQTSIIYIDFSKAFDVVQHDKLFVKLKAYGVQGTLLQWIMNLFACRKIQTRINDLLSDVCSLLCGVIQGSVIGPLMFLVYINDLVEILASFNIKVKLFADDVKLYVKIVNITNAVELQKALSALVAWADEWQLSISIDKCCVLHLGKATIVNQFHIKDIPLPLVSSYRDLGITVAKDLSPTVYINEIVVKAHQRANMIHRCFVSQNVELLTRAFVTYVRPLLEYNSVIWSPSLKRDIALIEQVQRRFTKRLPGLKTHPYEVRLKLLKLDTLELRRTRSDLIWCYKIVFGLVCVNVDDFFQLRLNNTRGHPYKLFKEFSSSSVRSTYFCERVINIWNRLPSQTVDFSSLNRFRKSIEVMDLDMLTS